MPEGRVVRAVGGFYDLKNGGKEVRSPGPREVPGAGNHICRGLGGV